MRYEEGWIDLATLDTIHKWLEIFLDVRLPRFHGERSAYEGSHWQVHRIYEYAGLRDSAAWPARHDGLLKGVRSLHCR
jgi:hypothetical protein